jgi:hypothetical protein
MKLDFGQKWGLAMIAVIIFTALWQAAFCGTTEKCPRCGYQAGPPWFGKR